MAGEGRQLDDFDLPLVSLEFIVDVDDNKQLLALEYWDHTIDDAGRVTWRKSVSEIASEYEHQQWSMASDIGHYCIAWSKHRFCDSCKTSLIISSRSAITSYRSHQCESCTAEAAASKLREQQELVERQRDDQRRRVLYLRERYAVIDEPESAILELDDWDFNDVLALDMLLLNATSDGLLRVPKAADRPFAHDMTWLVQRLKSLRENQVIEVHPTSPTDAFVWEVDNWDELDAPRYYPASCTWYMVGRGPLASRVVETSAALQAYCRNAGWPTRWVTEAGELASDVLCYEARRYYEWAVDVHDLPPLEDDRQVGELAQIVQSAVSQYSLGQCYSIIWSIAKDGAAVTQRHPYMPRQNATTHTLHRISQYVSKALGNNWNLTHFREQRDNPLSVITVRLFELLAISPLESSLSAIDVATASLVDVASRTEAHIVSGITPADYDHAFAALVTIRDAIDDAALLDSPMHPRAWLTIDTIHRLPELLTRARQLGCDRPDSYRSIYVAAELLDGIGLPGASGDVRAVIRDALAGDVDPLDHLAQLRQLAVEPDGDQAEDGKSDERHAEDGQTNEEDDPTT